jgi:hypothetical protein
MPAGTGPSCGAPGQETPWHKRASARQKQDKNNGEASARQQPHAQIPHTATKQLSVMVKRLDTARAWFACKHLGTQDPTWFGRTRRQTAGGPRSSALCPRGWETGQSSCEDRARNNHSTSTSTTHRMTALVQPAAQHRAALHRLFLQGKHLLLGVVGRPSSAGHEIGVAAQLCHFLDRGHHTLTLQSRKRSTRDRGGNIPKRARATYTHLFAIASMPTL